MSRPRPICCSPPVPVTDRPGNRSSRRYARLVRSIAAEFRLQESDAADVAQNTWLRLLAYGGTIRDPEKLGSWLATTARREASALLRRSRPEVAIGVGGRRDRGRGSLPRGRRRRRRDGRRGPAGRRRAQRSAAAPRERAVLPVARHQLRRGVAPNGAAGGKHRTDPDPDAEATAPDTGRDGTRRMIAAPHRALPPGTATAGSPRRTARRPAG